MAQQRKDQGRSRFSRWLRVEDSQIVCWTEAPRITLDVKNKPIIFWELVISSFRDKRTEAFYRGERVAALSGFARAAERKLDQLDAATNLGDLARPGNRLEALRGDRNGQWSIRINDQWRLCFEWPKGAFTPENVEIVDYH